MGETVKLANRSGDEIDLLGLAAAAGVAAIFAFFLVAGADAPIGALVAIDPGAVADRFALIAGNRQRFGLAVVEIEVLAVARPLGWLFLTEKVTSPAWADDANRTANENAAASRRAGMKDMETPDEESAPTADRGIMP